MSLLATSIDLIQSSIINELELLVVDVDRYYVCIIIVHGWMLNRNAVLYVQLGFTTTCLSVWRVWQSYDEQLRLRLAVR